MLLIREELGRADANYWISMTSVFTVLKCDGRNSAFRCAEVACSPLSDGTFPNVSLMVLLNCAQLNYILCFAIVCQSLHLPGFAAVLCKVSLPSTEAQSG